MIDGHFLIKWSLDPLSAYLTSSRLKKTITSFRSGRLRWWESRFPWKQYSTPCQKSGHHKSIRERTEPSYLFLLFYSYFLLLTAVLRRSPCSFTHHLNSPLKVKSYLNKATRSSPCHVVDTVHTPVWHTVTLTDRPSQQRYEPSVSLKAKLHHEVFISMIYSPIPELYAQLNNKLYCPEWHQCNETVNFTWNLIIINNYIKRTHLEQCLCVCVFVCVYTLTLKETR